MPVPKGLMNYAELLEFADSETIARIFEIVFDEEEDRRFMAAMPGTIAEIIERTGMPEEKIRAIARKLTRRGPVYGIPPQKPEALRLMKPAINFRDASMTWTEAPQEFFELWDRFFTEEVVRIAEGHKHPGARIIPIEQSVESVNTILDIDSARNVFADAELVSAVPCPCRTIARKNGRGQHCTAPDVNLCMQTNAFANGVLGRGAGERISNSEALKRLGDAEDAGLIHMVRNRVTKDMFMCNCCDDCCTALFMVNQTGSKRVVAPSRFQVVLDEDLCSGCGTCEERCRFDAVCVNDEGLAVIEPDNCYGCGNCVPSCPEDALSLVEVRSKDTIRVVI